LPPETEPVMDDILKPFAEALNSIYYPEYEQLYGQRQIENKELDAYFIEAFAKVVTIQVIVWKEFASLNVVELKCCCGAT
jgi:hypothetical protein